MNIIMRFSSERQASHESDVQALTVFYRTRKLASTTKLPIFADVISRSEWNFSILKVQIKKWFCYPTFWLLVHFSQVMFRIISTLTVAILGRAQHKTRISANLLVFYLPGNGLYQLLYGSTSSDHLPDRIFPIPFSHQPNLGSLHHYPELDDYLRLL